MNSSSASSLIRAKREGRQLDIEQLRAVAQGIGSGSWDAGQIGAFAMAVACRGMKSDECARFTIALRDSGSCLRWDRLNGPVLDKHSTGGVGDGVSLLLAPILAACGAYVPMISGRGLGHTGGTLDKLQSMRGYNIHPSPDRFARVVRQVGCAIVGQGADLVPADRRLYAVRDVTATVDVPELMVASILSKKLAGGSQALVLDIKTGSGAQLPSLAAAHALADLILATAKSTNLTTRVIFSDMNQMLGREAGNALELRAAIDLLCGYGDNPRLRALTLEICAKLLCMSGLKRDREEADRRVLDALTSGSAADRFARMLYALGSPGDAIERPEKYLPLAPITQAVLASSSGYVQSVDVRSLGQMVVDLGGGRTHPDQDLDYGVGLSRVVGVGDKVEPGQPLAIVHARTHEKSIEALQCVSQCFQITPLPVSALPLWDWYAPGKIS
jgi:thymidine phosphorylase